MVDNKVLVHIEEEHTFQHLVLLVHKVQHEYLKVHLHSNQLLFPFLDNPFPFQGHPFHHRPFLHQVSLVQNVHLFLAILEGPIKIVDLQLTEFHILPVSLKEPV